MDIPAVVCENLSGSDVEEVLFQNLSFRLNLGQGMLVLSDPFQRAEVLFRMLATWRKVVQGEVRWFGRTRKSEGEIEALDLRRRIAWIHAGTRLISNMSLVDNVTLGLIYHHRTPFKDAQAMVEPLLRQFGLFDRRYRRPAELSHEDQRLAAYVRELVKSPRLIVMEKPLSDLDQGFPLVMSEVRKRADNKEAAFILSEVSPWHIHSWVDWVLWMDGEGYRLTPESEFDAAGYERFNDNSPDRGRKA